jgi:tRNA (guanosine-2'-O-)-methyltransferase
MENSLQQLAHLDISFVDDIHKATFKSYLKGFFSPTRLDAMQQVLIHRTRFITPVLENLQDVNNINAVMRSAEAMGLQEVHIIVRDGKMKVAKSVARGAQKWMDVFRYADVPDPLEQCIARLKSKGYKIVSTNPTQTGLTPQSIPLQEPIALVFGEEKKGVSQRMLEISDYQLCIPMYGFMESLNISVAAGIALHVITERLRTRSNNWQLSIAERSEIELQWLMKNVERPDLLYAKFLELNKI